MSSSSTGPELSPWHAGELQMQREAGVAERMDAVGRRVIRSHLLEQHRLFYTELPFVVLGTVNASGEAWATVRAGQPGFLHSPDSFQLNLSIPRDRADPADGGMNDGDAIGLLGIQLETRRRNRLNGVISRHHEGGFSISVMESFGNCPRYINARTLEFSRDPSKSSAAEPTEELETLTGAAARLVQSADSFFVASYIGDQRSSRRIDVSHRGGKAGFTKLENNGALTIPDYAGNLFFNTLGNFLVNPRAGLVFVDWEQGDLLQMTGQAEVVFDASEAALFEGAERLWRFLPARIIRRPGSLPRAHTAQTS